MSFWWHVTGRDVCVEGKGGNTEAYIVHFRIGDAVYCKWSIGRYCFSECWMQKHLRSAISCAGITQADGVSLSQRAYIIPDH